MKAPEGQTGPGPPATAVAGLARAARGSARSTGSHKRTTNG
jgi:hypothetical protein